MDSTSRINILRNLLNILGKEHGYHKALLQIVRDLEWEEKRETAAPDLLEALKALVSATTRFMEENYTFSGINPLTTAKDAIAKAQGKET